MPRNKDVYLQFSGGKWVRYDAVGHMVKGEDYRCSAWYYFDNRTGALDTRRSSVIPSEYVEPLLEHLVTKSSRASAVPFAFLETVSPPE